MRAFRAAAATAEPPFGPLFATAGRPLATSALFDSAAPTKPTGRPITSEGATSSASNSKSAVGAFPTIQVLGGNLTLRHSVVNESDGSAQPAIQVLGGTVDTIRAATRSSVKRFYDRHYVPGHLVVAAAGNVQHEDLLRLLRDRGAETVSVAGLDYVFGRGNALYAKLEAGLTR